MWGAEKRGSLAWTLESEVLLDIQREDTGDNGEKGSNV